MDNFNLWFGALTIAASLYCLYTWIRIKRHRKLFPNALLLPKDYKPSDCLDEAGYLHYMGPRTLILGVAVLLIGVLDVLETMQGILTRWLGDSLWGIFTVLVLLPMALFIWFAACLVRARKRYWV